MLGDLRRPDRGAELLLAGDLTAEASENDTGAVSAQLDRWGTFGKECPVVRGNHDRNGGVVRACRRGMFLS
ncbi:hypothetical protein ACL02S_02330 [Nocardia sp. 004]|uniref:hypothetical protein n=1 Tax=Nocardia sp. 004 TaxID=3385978 RepID=UPI0039A095C6